MRMPTSERRRSFAQLSVQRSWAMPAAATRPVTLTFIHRDDPWSIDLHEGVTRKLAGGSHMLDIDMLIPTVSLQKWRISGAGGIFSPPLLLAHLWCMRAVLSRA